MKEWWTKEGALIKRLYLRSLSNLILVAIAIFLCQLVDGVVIGKFMGKDAMAAFGLISPIFLLIGTISGVLTSGTQAVCGKLLGKGNIERANSTYTIVMVVTAAYSVIIALTVYVFADEIAAILGAGGSESQLFELVKAYLYGLVPYFIFSSFVQVFYSVFYLDGGKKLVIAGSIVSTIVNISGDLLNVFLFKGGMFGMAYATSISSIAAFAVLLLHFRQKHILKLDFHNLEFTPLIGVCQYGLPKAIQNLASMLRTYLMNLMIAGLAIETALAAFSGKNIIGSFLGAVVIGIGSATILLGAVYVGEDDLNSVKQVFKVSCVYGLTISMVISLMTIIFADFLVAGITSDPETAAMTATALRWNMLCIPLRSLVIVFMNIYKAFGYKIYASVICAADNCLLVCLMAFIMKQPFGIDGIWMSPFAGELMMLLIILIVCIHKRGHFPQTLEDWMLLPEDFDRSEDERLRMYISTPEEAVKASADVHDFMKSKVSSRDAFFLALCTEEIGMNILTWGSGKHSPQSDKAVEIYLCRKKDYWLLRIRDDFMPFDPQKWFELHKSDDRISNYGIRIVFGMAEDIQYTNTLGINNLTLKTSLSSLSSSPEK